VFNKSQSAGVVAIVAVGLALGSSASFAQRPLKVRVGMVTVASQMALEIGRAKGIFAKYGFDVEIKPLTTGVQANQALAADQVDWSAGGVESTIVAASNGLPFKPYTMYAKGGDSLGILVRTESGIKTLADLKGKRIAVASGTASAQGLSQVLKSLNLPNDAVQKVNANFGNMGQMVIQGAVDGMVGLEPFLTLTMQKMGDNAVLLTRLGKYVQGGGLFLISDKWAAAHSDKLRDAVEALWEAEKFVRDNAKEASDIEAKAIKADPAVVEASIKWLSFNPLLDDFTLASLKTTSDYLASEKIINHDVDLNALVAPARRIERELKAKRPDLLK
jgi:ABC-type nitrate/sulfonate/bicarbonate transport system substrate-binding protein